MTTSRRILNTPRIGPRMQAAHIYVQTHPGCSMTEASVAIGPHHSKRYGYLAVTRAIDAGLIVRIPHPTHRHWWALYSALCEH